MREIAAQSGAAQRLNIAPIDGERAVFLRGGFDDAARGGSFAISQAYDRYPLAVKLHLADLESTYLREKGSSDVR